MTRNDAIRRIRAALQKRSEKPWSVTGGRGTAYGWIQIDAPPSRRTWKCRLRENCYDSRDPKNYEMYDSGSPGGSMGPDDQLELARLLGIEKNSVNYQGEKVPASDEYYQEYIDRAEGRIPTVQGKQYWD